MKIQPAVLATSMVLAGILMLGGVLPTQAQDLKTQPQPSPAQQPEFSQGQIEAFASAALQLRDIRAKWQPRMEEAGSAEKAQELQAQANAEMESAVKDKGMTVETYNAIVIAARDDPELAELIVRTVKHMEQTR